jgi:hypothetical protein
MTAPLRVDGRRKEMRAARDAAAVLVDALGGPDAVNDFQRAECQRLGELVAIARAQRLRRAMGDTSISITDLVTLENVINRALQGLKLTSRSQIPLRRRSAHYQSEAIETGEFERLVSGLPDSKAEAST